MAPTVGIAGLGLMGGSLALALARRGTAVVGYDPHPDTVAAARSQGLAADTRPQALAACDLVFVAAPLSQLAETFRTLADCRGFITDLGSTKAPVIAWGEAVFGDRFIGGHPMAGSEKTGFSGANPDLFAGAVWVLTPTSRTNPEGLVLVRQVLTPLAVRLTEMTPEAHDEAVAAISHLPYLAACALAETARRQPGQEAVQLLAASGFRDTTRLAMTNPVLGRDLCLTNRAALMQLLPQLQAVLAEWQAQIESGNEPALDTALTDIAAWRRQFTFKADR